MSEHMIPPDLEKWPAAFQWALNIGILLGGAVMAMLGYRRRKANADPDDASPEVAKLNAEATQLRAELDEARRALDQQNLIRSLEEVLRATRQGIYVKIDQSEEATRRAVDGGVSDIQKEIAGLKSEIADLAREIGDIKRRPTR